MSPLSKRQIICCPAAEKGAEVHLYSTQNMVIAKAGFLASTANLAAWSQTSPPNILYQIQTPIYHTTTEVD